MQRLLESQSNAPLVSLLEQSLKHRWQNDRNDSKARTMADLFSPQLGFFGDRTMAAKIAEDALRGLILMDEENMGSQSTIGRAVSWQECTSPPLHGIPLWQQDQYLKEWTMIPVLHDNDIQYVDDAFKDDMTLFHGTIAKCAFKIIEIGFLPGPNGHVKNKKYYHGERILDSLFPR